MKSDAVGRSCMEFDKTGGGLKNLSSVSQSHMLTAEQSDLWQTGLGIKTQYYGLHLGGVGRAFGFGQNISKRKWHSSPPTKMPFRITHLRIYISFQLGWG